MVRHCDTTIGITLLFAGEEDQDAPAMIVVEAESHEDVTFSEQTRGTSASRGDGCVNDSSENFSYTIAGNCLEKHFNLIMKDIIHKISEIGILF
jgi:hypothetical protein